MKIAISSVGKEEGSKISEVSGRAPYYLIFENGRLVKTIKNPFRFGGGGAGFSVAEMLSEEGVEMVISGRIGPNMKRALESKGIKYQEKTGIVKDVISEIERGDQDSETKEM